MYIKIPRKSNTFIFTQEYQNEFQSENKFRLSIMWIIHTLAPLY